MDRVQEQQLGTCSVVPSEDCGAVGREFLAGDGRLIGDDRNGDSNEGGESEGHGLWGEERVRDMVKWWK